MSTLLSQNLTSPETSTSWNLTHQCLWQSLSLTFYVGNVLKDATECTFPSTSLKTWLVVFAAKIAVHSKFLTICPRVNQKLLLLKGRQLSILRRIHINRESLSAGGQMKWQKRWWVIPFWTHPLFDGSVHKRRRQLDCEPRHLLHWQFSIIPNIEQYDLKTMNVVEGEKDLRGQVMNKYDDLNACLHGAFCFGQWFRHAFHKY